MHYRKNEESPLRLSEGEMEEAVRQYLANKGREEAGRIKHIVFHRDVDEHSYSPMEARVYLREKEEGS